MTNSLPSFPQFYDDDTQQETTTTTTTMASLVSSACTEIDSLRLKFYISISLIVLFSIIIFILIVAIVFLKRKKRLGLKEDRQRIYNAVSNQELDERLELINKRANSNRSNAAGNVPNSNTIISNTPRSNMTTSNASSSNAPGTNASSSNNDT